MEFKEGELRDTESVISFICSTHLCNTELEGPSPRFPGDTQKASQQKRVIAASMLPPEGQPQEDVQTTAKETVKEI